MIAVGGGTSDGTNKVGRIVSSGYSFINLIASV